MSGVVLPGAGGSKEDDYGEVMKVRECDVNEKMWTAARGFKSNNHLPFSPLVSERVRKKKE